MKLTRLEIALLARLSKVCGYKHVELTRKSDREFDFEIEGQDAICGFSAWTMLAGIHSIDYWRADIAGMTDYPDMTREGDWSGVRDTDEAKQWAIFEKYVVPLLDTGK